MSQFVIEIVHDPEECVKALREFETYSEDLLNQIYWSCVSGNHTGRIVVEAGSLEEARNLVPEPLRDRVTVWKADQILAELAEPGVIDPETKNPADSALDSS
jgi:hypothetical protein